MYVGRVALGNLVACTATVHRMSLVARLMTNVQQLIVLENFVLVNFVARLMTNVQQPVLGNGVTMIATVLPRML